MSEIRKELEHFARKLNIGRDTPANQDDREPEASDAAAAEKPRRNAIIFVKCEKNVAIKSKSNY